MDLTVANNIDALENAMRESKDCLNAEQVDVQHYLADSGVYARELIMPAGMLVTGKAKKKSYISILTAGFITEVTPLGKRNIKAPAVLVSEPGIKRALLAHELSVIVTVHHTNYTSIPDIEEDILVPSTSEDLWHS